jgi:hypothetical protein
MKRVLCQPGSPQWIAERLGIPTASQFHRILTPKTLKLSEQRVGYAHELIAEHILGRPMDDVSSGFMERGNLLERQAISFYEFQEDVDTEVAGFLLRDNLRAGATPDRLVGANGLLELKVPSPPTHIAYLLDAEGIGYRAQVQGQLWVSEREWVDTLSYHPEMPAALVRQHRDEKFITALAEAVDLFNQMMDDMKAKLVHLGHFPDLHVPDLKIA